MNVVVFLRRGPVRINLPHDDKGHFERQDVPPGTWSLELMVRGRVRARIENVDVGATEVVIRYPNG